MRLGIWIRLDYLGGIKDDLSKIKIYGVVERVLDWKGRKLVFSFDFVL